MAACPYPRPSCNPRSGRQKFCRQKIRGDRACAAKKPLANIFVSDESAPEEKPALIPGLRRFPFRLRSDLVIDHLCRDSFCHTHGRSDGRNHLDLARYVPRNLSRLTGFRVDSNSRRNSSVIRKPVLRHSALLPHCRHFRCFLQFCQCRRSAINALQRKV